ncbi:MAG: TSUP family transporter [Nitrospiraceae bacterium]|nr:TSUP family transporter [Nitrospiraceae bacterium]
MEIYLFVFITIFFAGFTQGLSGFGSTLLAIPILTVFLDIKTIIPLTALTGLAMTLFLLIQLWKHLVWKKIISFLIGMLPGIPMGVFFLKKVDKSMVQLLLGSLLIAYSVYSLFFRAPPKGTRDRWAYFLGFLEGCLRKNKGSNLSS